jgi:hypothetical protein
VKSGTRTRLATRFVMAAAASAASLLLSPLIAAMPAEALCHPWSGKRFRGGG